MGCDIHYVMELKHPKYGWVGVASTDVPVGIDVPYEQRKDNFFWCFKSRDYDFFARVAGVRGEGPPALGLPKDASTLTLSNHENWGSDAHSASYMSLYDFAKAKMGIETENVAMHAAKKLTGVDPVVEWLAGGKDPLDQLEYLDVHTSIRMCFWFDN